MSRKACLVVLAALSACIDAAVQGTTVPDEQTTDASTDATAADTSTSTSTTSDPTVATTSTSDATSSTTGPVPTCSDDQLNQDESDVDCGGACPPCDADAACNDDADCKSGECDAGACFPLFPSCLDLLTARPGLPSDAYPLDPDGDGANPLPFFCDMEGGGWTQVFLDAFEAAPNAAWSLQQTGECGPIGTHLGPFGMGDTAALPITAQQVPHSELRLVSEVVIIDSWDPNDEKFMIRLDGAPIFEQTCDHTAPFSCGQNGDLCGSASFNDGELIVAPDPIAHAQDAIGLEFTSTLNEAKDNEAWGLDKVVVFVK